MSGGGDNFLARWSRRKREVEEAEEGESSRAEREGPSSSPGADDPSPPRGERLGEGSSGVEFGVNDPTPSPSPQGGGEPAEPLPRLDDLTSESDLSAFLRKGVPDALKQAALRRMWSLDPAIRDHVGLAEYAWDFNNPASIPGFGTVAAGTPMAQLAANVMSAGKEADAGDAAMGDAAQAGPAEASPATSPSSISRTDPPLGARAPESGPSKRELPAPGDSPLGGGSEVRDESPAETENRPVPRHGGAMPR